MKDKASSPVWAVVIVAILVMGGIAGIAYYEKQKAQHYWLRIEVTNTTDMGNVSIGSSNYNVLGDYLNVSLLGNEQYRINFRDYFIGPLAWENQTLTVFMANNKTLNVSALNITSYTPIQISTNLTNASLTYQQEVVHPTNNRSRYFYSNGTAIYGWIQDNNTTWIELNGEINRTIYLCDYSTFQLSNDSYMGSGTSYFNANLVFPYAFNFHASSYPAGWTGNATINSTGLYVLPGTSLIYFPASNLYSNTLIVNGSLLYNSTGGGGYGFMGNAYTGYGSINAVLLHPKTPYIYLRGADQISNSIKFNVTQTFISTYNYSSISARYYINSAYIGNLTTTTQNYINKFSVNSGGTNYFQINYWLEESNIVYDNMPSYSFGSSVSY